MLIEFDLIGNELLIFGFTDSIKNACAFIQPQKS
jgi:hypothetical protein